MSFFCEVYTYAFGGEASSTTCQLARINATFLIFNSFSYQRIYQQTALQVIFLPLQAGASCAVVPSYWAYATHSQYLHSSVQRNIGRTLKRHEASGRLWSTLCSLTAAMCHLLMCGMPYGGGVGPREMTPPRPLEVRLTLQSPVRFSA